jgi:hypothetical protein
MQVLSLLRHTLNGAVQPTVPPQQPSPTSPHMPPMQPPPVHVPWPREHADPSATHCPRFWSQQASVQSLPAQQGSPAPPHVEQVPVESQTRPVAVQKLAMLPAPIVPGQQGCPSPPQLSGPASQAPASPHCAHPPPTQRAADPPRPQGAFAATQAPPTQQAPAPLHVLSWQQGRFGPPQPTRLPFLQTVPIDWFSPDARHVPPPQHPPPLHMFPAQQV